MPTSQQADIFEARCGRCAGKQSILNYQPQGRER